MIKMSLSEAKRKYYSTRFGNEPCEIGNVCWIIERDEDGMFESLVEIVDD